MKRNIFAILILMFLISCSATIISHDEDMAAKSAIDFAKVAIVQHDISKGYAMLSDNFKKTITIDKYTQVMSQIHPSLYPLSLTAVEFEPIPGQKGMNIFLYGENGPEKFYYRLVMEGTAATGYRVLGIYRGNGPAPPSKLRQKLKSAYST
jgi:hypothetical protein